MNTTARINFTLDDNKNATDLQLGSYTRPLSTDACIAEDDEATLTLAIAALCKCMADLRQISASSFKMNYDGRACDDVDHAVDQMDEIRSMLSMARG